MKIELYCPHCQKMAFTVDTLPGFYVVQPTKENRDCIVVRNELTELPIIIQRMTTNDQTIYKGWFQGQPIKHTNLLILVCKMELLENEIQ